MQSEFRFDDLDLREQPASSKEQTDGPTAESATCTNTKYCTFDCCNGSALC